MTSTESFYSDVIRHLRETNFGRNPRDYSGQASSRSESRMTPSRKSSLRGSSRSQYTSRPREESRSRESRDQSERPFQQSSMRHLLRESSIARNFLRQPPLSSPQSKVQEIPSSEIPEIPENSYSGSPPPSSPKNPYILQPPPEKESIPRQWFQPRSPKFYQSPQLPEQFYKRPTGYSSPVPPRPPVPPSPSVPPLPSVPPRSLPHEYSSLVPSRSFASPSSSSLNQSIKTPGTDYRRELVNLVKLYSDDAKYDGENDNFSFKLIMFNNMCDRVDVCLEIKMKVFSIMLKNSPLNYYYLNMTSNDHSITFNDVCISMMNYFEDAEYKRSILNKWNNLTLNSVMSKAENKEKSLNECFQLLIQEIRHLQHDLESTLRIDNFIHNKLINACSKVSACQYACFKPSETLTELINDLKSSIMKLTFSSFLFLSSSSLISPTVVIIAIFNPGLIKIEEIEYIRIENNIEGIRIEEINIVREKYALSVTKKNVDQRSIQKTNAKKRNGNSKIVSQIRWITESINT